MRKEFFVALDPTGPTHNDLEPVRRRGGGLGIRKSDALRAHEDALAARIAPHRPPEPFSRPVHVDMRICFPTGGRHPQGSPHAVRPDADNVEKTVFDILERFGFIRNDCLIASHCTAKAWSDPAGIWILIREIGDGGEGGPDAG